MKYKLVAIDMDGTLLDNEHRVSAKNEAAITNYAKEGVSFILASGRPYQSLYPYSKELEVYLPLVTSNGSIIKCPLTDSVYYKSEISFELVDDILKYAESDDCSISLYFEDEVITSSKEVAQVHYDLEGLKANQVEKFNLDKSPTKIIFYDDPTKIDKVYVNLIEKYEDVLYITKSDEKCIEVMSLEVSKGKALKYMMDKMNIKAEEVIAIGNQINDIAMFEVAGLAIAMDNSPQEVKDLADFVTKSNQDSGVAYALDRFLGRKSKF